MEDDLYKSEAWIKATPQQRLEFVAKLRAAKRIEKERMAKALKQKKQQPAVESRSAKKKSRKAAAKERKRSLHSRPANVASERIVKVAGVDVTSKEFLETYEWRKLRMQALKKYGARCMCCGASPATGAVMNVDHIKPRKLFPSLALDINNLQVLCHECNHGKGNWDQTDWR